MKKLIIEPDFLGGQGKLTEEEENALAKYFAQKKAKAKGKITVKQSIKKQVITT